MKKVERMIKLFDEEVNLHMKIDSAMPWMTESSYRKHQESLKIKFKRNIAKQLELASKMTYEEKEELYRQTEINLNEL